MTYTPKPIASLTIRLAGTVAYRDGSKGSFAGVWDGKRFIFPNGASEIVAAKTAFHDSSTITSMNDGMSDSNNPSSGGVYFTFTPPSGTPPVRDVVMSLSGNIAHKDGSNTSYEVTHQLLVGTTTLVTLDAMLDIVGDTVAHNIMNTLLTDAAGFHINLA